MELIKKYWWAIPVLLILYLLFFSKKKRRRVKRGRNGKFVSTRRVLGKSRMGKPRFGTKAYYAWLSAKGRRARKRLGNIKRRSKKAS